MVSLFSQSACLHEPLVSWGTWNYKNWYSVYKTKMTTHDSIALPNNMECFCQLVNLFNYSLLPMGEGCL